MVKKGTLVKRGTSSGFRKYGGGGTLFLAVAQGYGYFSSLPPSQEEDQVL